MVIQIVNLTFPETFKWYSNYYNIYREVYSKDLLGLEIRNISSGLAENIQDIVLREKEICYKKHKNYDNLIDLFIPGTLYNFKALSHRILSFGDEDTGYRLINVIKNYEEYNQKAYNIGGKEFIFDRSYVMGILNITPDSFSDGGLYLNTEDAVNHALKMSDEGADIIDVGGESTRPGAEAVDAEEEIERIIPVVEKILESNNEIIISVDTTKSAVAREALKRGAKIINDVSSLTFDPLLIDTVKEYNASLIIMHMQGKPRDMQINPHYENVVKDIYDFLYNQAYIADKAGIQNIFIDPGIGFGKTIEHNFKLLKRLEDFKGMGYPILIGVSRKSFIGKTLSLDMNERDTPTSVVESIAVKNGARIIRTHNVKNGVHVCKLLNHLQ